MSESTVQFTVMCKRCGVVPVGYSGMMYERMKEFGHSRPEYCEACRAILLMEKMTMGAAYFSLKMLPGADKNVVIPGELGKVWHPNRPHVKEEKPKTFDASKFGATPNKVVELYEWLKDPKHQVAIIKGGTGSGKSTALPYWLIYPPEGVPSDFFIRNGQIVITQPRILATTGVTKYLGTLMGSSVGKGFDIGYRYSKDRNADRFNAAFMATDGSLINMIKQGQLADLSVVMIDEAHERSLNIDIILKLMKNMLPLYPHLKLLIVSATLNAEKFLEYFGTETAALIEFEPKSKFIYIGHFADESEKIHYENPSRLKKEIVGALVNKTMWLLNEQVEGRKGYGHILGFLQGVKPIDEAVSLLRAAVASNPKLKDLVEVLPLYSALDEKDSDYAISIPKTSVIRVIVATNVAEASITVEGVVYVIESGIENQAQWEVEDSKKTVELRRISKANARQRFGRSGRTRNGEVFTLYTEAQYDEMIDFPIPAIQRSSMEEQFLKLKELGIDEFIDGWIDSPKVEEFSRAVSSLKNSGAIDREDMLTEYGVLLTQFQYPASLADLLILADRFGCAVEVATLLPIIKNGGYRSFFVKDTNWDEPTKQKVMKIQNVLSLGCRDDVEFIFRMYSFWKNPPVSIGPKGSRPKSLKERREEFEKTFFVDFKVFEEDIDSERWRIMRLLNAHRKDPNVREINFRLLERTRTVVAYCIPYTLAVEGSYEFNPKQESENGAAICVLAISKERAEEIKKLKDRKDSFFKLSRESAKWEKKTNNGGVSDEERILKKPEIPDFDTKPFKEFVSRYEKGDEVEVVVVGYAEHAGDFRVSLTVKEPETGYETWLTPSDLNFTQSSAVIKQIPIGTKLRVLVKNISLEKSFVKLFCLPLLEAELKKTYKAMSKTDGQVVTKARVIDVRTDGKLVFVAELSRPEEGFVLVIHANDNERVLEKPAQSFKVGDTYWVSFKVDSDFEYRANLISVSDILSKYLKQPGSRLSWVDKKLCFKEKMNYADWLELSKIDTDESFLAALDYLYLSSNTNWASKVKDAKWFESVKEKYAVGKVIEVTIKKIISVGMVVILPGGQSGFVRTGNPGPSIKEGSAIKAKVIDFDELRQQVNLSIAIPENNALMKLSKGQRVQGVVDNLKDYGAFVNLGLGNSGLIHKSNMGRRVNYPSDILYRGDIVLVEIISIEDIGGKQKISLKLIEIVSSGA